MAQEFGRHSLSSQQFLVFVGSVHKACAINLQFGATRARAQKHCIILAYDRDDDDTCVMGVGLSSFVTGIGLKLRETVSFSFA